MEELQIGKYLKDINLKYGETPQTMLKGDSRSLQWEQERKIYGFDNRETWSLDYTLALFMYQRLLMYKELNCIDTDFHKYEYENKTITYTECLDRMIEGFKIKILINLPNEEQYKKICDAYKLIGVCHNELWW